MDAAVRLDALEERQAVDAAFVEQQSTDAVHQLRLYTDQKLTEMRAQMTAISAQQEATQATTAQIQEAGNRIEERVNDNASKAEKAQEEQMKMLKAILARSAPKRSHSATERGGSARTNASASAEASPLMSDEEGAGTSPPAKAPRG